MDSGRTNLNEIDSRITSYPTNCRWQWYAVQLTEHADGTFSAQLGDVVTRDRDPSTAARCCIIEFNTGLAHDWSALFEQYQMEVDNVSKAQE
jgi:hypothetical protein